MSVTYGATDDDKKRDEADKGEPKQVEINLR